MATEVELLELDGVGQRIEGARFELRDVGGLHIGSITPARVVSIENRAEGAIKRTVVNFSLPPSVVADVNLLTDRVWAYSTIGAVDYPLGVFLFASYAGNRRSYGTTAATRLLDQGLIMGQSIPYSIGFPAGAAVTACIASVFDQAGFHTYDIYPSPVALSSPLAWPANPRSTWAVIASELCKTAGLTDWFFDNTGALRVIDAPSLSGATPILRYGSNGRIIAGSIIEQNDLLEAPNRYIAIDTASREAPVVGSYDIPNAAPNSIGQRGFPITKTIEAPGVGTDDRAAAYAQAYSQTDPKAYETVTFSAAPDPRHDTFDVVEYFGANYQELSWRLTCAPGGPHQHTLKRVLF